MVAVLVVHDPPGEQLDRVVAALAAQDHPNLDVLVVVTGPDDPTERVRAVLPAARIHRVDGSPAFGIAANVVLDIVSGAEFFVFCHDDAAPDPGAVRALVAAAQQGDADVVGPKLVEWDDPARFTQFGLTIDKLGVTVPFVERGELDQGQHDGIHDVLAVPGAFTLVRASRFAEVGGFDEGISHLGDDVSLAVRVRLAGGRVLLTSAARVRHCESLAARPEAHRVSALAARHRLRLLLTTYRPLTLVRLVPQALLLSLLEALGALVTGRAGRARDVLGAWPWNLWRARSLLTARRQVAAMRRVGDREIRRYQVRGVVGPRLRLLRVGADGRTGAGWAGSGARRVAAVPVRGRPEVDPAAWSPATVLVALTLAALVVFGSRHLVTRFVPVVGEMVPPGGGAGDLLSAWAGGWRPAGLGAEGATPPLAGALGLLAALLGGHAGLARTLAVVGLLPLGIVGAHRLAAPTGVKAAQVAAAVAYAAVPLPYEALSAGRWSALAAWAGAPWMLGRLARASGTVPFGPAGPGEERILPGGAADDLVVGHRLGKQAVAVGAVTGLTGLLVPQAPLLLVVMGAGLVAGSLLVRERRGLGRVVGATAGGLVVAVALGLPTALDVVTSPGGVEAWLGREPVGDTLAATDLLTLRTGTESLPALAPALLVAASVPLLVGRRWRLGWAARGWAVALVAWALLWVRAQWWSSLRLPDPGVVLAPAAAGLAMAVGLGVAAVEHDVRGRSWRFGLRRIGAAVGLLALCAAAAFPVVGAMDGWWDMPGDDHAGLLRPVDDRVRAVPSRVLWVGEPGTVPGAGAWELGDRLVFTASTGAALPGVADLWPAVAGGASGRLGDALRLALDRETSRLGRVLAPLGVQYVAVPLAPAPSSGAAGPVPGEVAALVDVLAGQLDLERVPASRELVLYRNTEMASLRSATTGPVPEEHVPVAPPAPGDTARSRPVLGGEATARGGRGPVRAGETVVQASTASEHWGLTVDGRPAAHRAAGGWADAFAVERDGEAELVYRTPAAFRALLAAQALLWLLVLAVVLRMRFGGIEPPAPAHRGRGAARDGEGASPPGAGAPSPAAGVPAEPGAEPAAPEPVVTGRGVGG